MNEITADKVAMVVDEGIFIELAIRLSRDFKLVKYHSPWVSEYPKSKDDMIGFGVPEIERVSDFWNNIDDVDIFIFPSIYHGDMQLHLESLGKRVWGSRMADELERSRWKANELFKSLGLPRPEMEQVIGIDALRERLKEVDDRYIKVDDYRGNGETWHHENYLLSEPIIDEMEHDLGDEKKVFKWIIETPISGDDVVETGYDGYCIDGQYPDRTIFGYEKKDAGYICRVKDYTKMSPIITDFNEKISKELKNHRYRNFMSTEIRAGKDKVPYMIDFTAREPSPPGELYMEMVSNLAEIIWFGAEGVMVQPEFEAEYGLQVMIDSDWGRNKWQAIHFPKEIRRWIKLRNFTIIDKTYCVIPRYPDFNNMGALVAMGDSIDHCVDQIKEMAEQIKGYDLDIKIGAIDKLKEIISKGEKIGLRF